MLMNNTNSAKLNIAHLKKQTSEQLQAQAVIAVVLALGSNHQAEQHLATIRKNLAELGDTKLSSAFQNPDFTATPNQPKPDYINQCVYLELTSSMTLRELQQIFKQLEYDCHRQRQVEKTAIKQVIIDQVTIDQITMDIDILLVRLSGSHEWIVMADRYPFKAHELVGVVELAVEKSFIF